MKIVFTPEEKARAKFFITVREKPKRDHAVPSQRITNRKTDEEIDYLGSLAEIAVARVLGTTIEVKWIVDGDAGFDMVWHGKKVETKYTTFKNSPELYIRGNKENLADIFVLVNGDENEMNILGWISRDDFKRNWRWKDYGNRGKPVKAVTLDKLKPIEALK